MGKCYNCFFRAEGDDDLDFVIRDNFLDFRSFFIFGFWGGFGFGFWTGSLFSGDGFRI